MFKTHRQKKPQEAVEEIHVSRAQTGNSYGTQTDNQYYVLLCFLNSVFDERVQEDAVFMRDFYFSQNCLCVTLWFKGEDVSPYMKKDIGFLYDPVKKYYVFFNPEQMQQARGVDGDYTVYYPKDMTNPYILLTTDDNSMQHSYQVFNGKVRNTKPLVDDYVFGQYFGFVKHDSGAIEFIYAYAVDIM